MHIPKSHPRYASLVSRDLIVAGVKHGITSLDGLTAHGTGLAFDYLLGEKTHPFANEAIRAAALTLLSAKHPVISVNGNTAALVPKELVNLSNVLAAPLEVNLFHSSKKREKLIKRWLKKHGAKHVLLPGKTIVPGLESNRRFVHAEGIYKADVVFVPLEDGDRTKALIKMGKKVITVDLNPLSRTAKKATITIVDNILRIMPLLISDIKILRKLPSSRLPMNPISYNNNQSLKEAEKIIRSIS